MLSGQQDLYESFVNISFENVDASGGPNGPYDAWKTQNSHVGEDKSLAFTNILRKAYPDHAVQCANTYGFPILSLPDVLAKPIPGEKIDSIIMNFVPFARKTGTTGGVLMETLRFAGFIAAWKSYDFFFYVVAAQEGFMMWERIWVVHKGPEEVINQLLLAAGTWFQDVRDEILVYDQGFWQKDHALWEEIQKFKWDDVILKQEFKDQIQGDIESFFKSEAVYKELAVPWKRGLLFYGPAGNGKTISLKAAMHATNNPILYVRTLHNFWGDEKAMADIFGMARRFSPCLLIMEDLDSHIDNSNRSFFLNQLDGIDSNDGILMIATTNHIERLDNSISNRPSRFDRKYLFDDPDEQERRLYCGYWQKKLQYNKKVEFPDSLADEIAKESDSLSFAYLKEAFVATLILMAGNPEFDFAQTLKGQVKDLKDQIKHRPAEVSAPLRVAPAPLPRLKPEEDLLLRRNQMRPETVIPSPNMSIRRWI